MKTETFRSDTSLADRLGKHKPLPEAEQLKLLRKARAGDKKAEETLILSYARLVIKIAYDVSPSPEITDDMVIEGLLGLITGLQRFDFRPNVQIHTYASWWIKQRIRRHLAGAKVIRLPVHVIHKLARLNSMLRQFEAEGKDTNDNEALAKALGVSVGKVTIWRMHLAIPASFSSPITEDGETLESLLPDEEAVLSPSVMGHKENRKIVKEALSTLPKRTAQVLKSRFGMGEEPKTLEQLGKTYDVSRERVRQIERDGLKLLRAYFRRRRICLT
jgi:RNA polymerase primary sigma factor